MAVYKVPQDVEADDKLIGPFSFRQFIYLIIVALAGAAAWGLSRLFIPLAIIPLPVILFFGALALPLRKDQPMEIYLAALVSFYLKPRKRLWEADGVQSLIEVTAPKILEVQRTKELSQDEAQKRLSYLADIVDTGGWAIRGVAMPDAPSAMKSDVFYEAQQTEDILADDGGVSRSFDAMINEADARRRQEVMQRMQASSTPPPPDPYANLPQTSTSVFTPATDPRFTFNPYPSSMRQSVVQPLSEQTHTPAPQPAPVVAQPTPVAPPQPQPAPTTPKSPQVVTPQPAPVATNQSTAPVAPPVPVASAEPPVSTSEKEPSADIINLVNSSGLSIETIAHEAQRIREREEKKSDDDEVIISLR